MRNPSGKPVSLNILIAGEGSAAARMLQLVARAGHRIAGVFSPSGAASGPSSPLLTAARTGGHGTWPAEWLGVPERSPFVQDMGADLLLTLRMPVVVHPSFLDIFTVGCFNLHTGPLPSCPGLDAVSWALFRGERIHGATVHRITESIDGGPVAYGKTFPIGDEDRALDVLARTLREGLSLMKSLVDQAALDPAGIPSHPQDRRERRFPGAGPPRGGAIDWDSPAREVFNFVRACDYFPMESPWGHPHALLEGNRVGLARVRPTGLASGEKPGRVGLVDGGSAHIACADEWLLVEQLIIREELVDAAEVLRTGLSLGNGKPVTPTP